MSFKKQQWPEFNIKMIKLVSEQFEEFCEAVCGDDYCSLLVVHKDQVLMTLEQCKKQFDKVVKCKVKDSFHISNSSSLESATKLRIAWNDAHITHLHPNQVADLW